MDDGVIATDETPGAATLIGRYARAERVACASLSNRAIQAFSPMTFDQLGYPATVTSGGELVGEATELMRRAQALGGDRLLLPPLLGASS